MTEIKASNLGGRAASGWVRWLAPITLMAVIFLLSAQPYDGGELAWWEVAGRKLGHFLGYALLALAWAWALAARSRHRLLIAAGLSLGYAVSDEYHQTFVSGRTGTPQDVAIDALGIAAALLLVSRRPRAARA